MSKYSFILLFASLLLVSCAGKPKPQPIPRPENPINPYNTDTYWKWEKNKPPREINMELTPDRKLLKFKSKEKTIGFTRVNEVAGNISQGTYNIEPSDDQHTLRYTNSTTTMIISPLPGATLQIHPDGFYIIKAFHPSLTVN